jgi:hypothetical protein
VACYHHYNTIPEQSARGECTTLASSRQEGNVQLWHAAMEPSRHSAAMNENDKLLVCVVLAPKKNQINLASFQHSSIDTALVASR